MSVITVQAGVGRHVLDRQPEQARSALAVIETTGREALQELGRLLGVLREDGCGPARAPAPRIADLDDVIRAAYESGLLDRQR
ncbi:histidine kinase dimerization/phosphoacceptor domain-containing protein [Actinocrinis puniceicyclus]|uniref:Histidine kinase dimerization/phosphoacceptor domain-containing protein n=1 Tax=Actinocrinis puniceicyclus TaxID=977794 RepID=A0A8J7WQ54_9ACTN|nr:histidine kinase dimerization/phosphoacceptor domain-containing protein [Actinocrinis puniceicyclus]MBS2963495.1 histidine kinase dimerization/phosphoacceptor domain-containing protein [Actinocrinis puniceicyclus]